jgi:uncharacterized protein YodC (DUF2158 family)
MDESDEQAASNARKIERGDVVRFKSGGPFMTVVLVREYEDEELGKRTLYSCAWFWSGRYLTESFGGHEIELVSADDLKAAREFHRLLARNAKSPVAQTTGG